MRATTRALALTLMLAGCGPTVAASNDGGGGRDGPPAPIEGLVSLTLYPPDATLEIIGSNSAQERYSAVGTFEDGHKEDVTASVTFSLDDPSLGDFAGTLFTSNLTAGQTTVRARNGSIEGETSLTLVYVDAFFAPGAPADAPRRFADAAPGGATPEIVYPPDGTLIPPNLTLLDVQFRPGSGNDLFEVRFRGEMIEVRVYAPCTPVGGGCSVMPDEETWGRISALNAGREPLELEVRGLDEQAGKTGLSATQTLGIAEKNVLGGIYYWAADPGEIIRYDFGLPTPQGEKYYTAAEAGSTCVGCHTLSQKGNLIAVGLDAPINVSALQVLEVATKTKRFQLGQPMAGGGSNFQAFSPDESEIITSNGGTLVLRDALNLGAEKVNPLVPLGTMADFAPDGSGIVFAKPAVSPCMMGNICNPGIDKGSIVLLPRDGDTWGPEQVLVPQTGTENNYYPAFSPDGEWVLYNHSASNNSYDAADASLRVVSAHGGAAMALAAADGTGGNSWPKWGPFVQEHRGGTIMWLTFSSRRAYGLRLSAGQRAQLWMAAFDPARTEVGEDPSYPAFWLPFQDVGTGNHIAQWVEGVERQPCVDNVDCAPGEVCSGDGVCIPDID